MRRFLLAGCCFLLLYGVVGGIHAQDLAALKAEGSRGYAAFDNPRALAAYERALRLAPTDFDLLISITRVANDLAQDLMTAGQKSQAEQRFQQAVGYAEALKRHHPSRVETYFFLAATYGNLALFKGGKEKVQLGRDVETYCKRAIQLNPRYALSYVALGIFYREVSDLNWVQRTFANALFGGVPSGTKQDAIRNFTRALELDPALSVAHYEIAKTYEALGQREQAATHYRRVVELRPANTQDRRNQDWSRELLRRWGR
jgi:tetratricopeptide (TPR) repeat protein